MYTKKHSMWGILPKMVPCHTNTHSILAILHMFWKYICNGLYLDIYFNPNAVIQTGISPKLYMLDT